MSVHLSYILIRPLRRSPPKTSKSRERVDPQSLDPRHSPSEANEEPDDVLEIDGEGFTGVDLAYAGERCGVMAALKVGDDPPERSIRRASDPPDAANRS